MDTVYLIVCLLFNVVHSRLLRSRCPFVDATKKPEDVSQISLIEDVLVLEACMIRCDQDEDCESFVFEETIRRCFLYNTTVGVRSLVNGQKAINKQLDQCTHSKLMFIFIIAQFILFIITGLRGSGAMGYVTKSLGCYVLCTFFFISHCYVKVN